MNKGEMSMIGKILILIAILLLACLGWAAVAHLRKKGPDASCGGICAGCSMKDGCSNMKKQEIISGPADNIKTDEDK